MTYYTAVPNNDFLISRTPKPKLAQKRNSTAARESFANPHRGSSTFISCVVAQSVDWLPSAAAECGGLSECLANSCTTTISEFLWVRPRSANQMMINQVLFSHPGNPMARLFYVLILSFLSFNPSLFENRTLNW
jgi:hypothetical protein